MENEQNENFEAQGVELLDKLQTGYNELEIEEPTFEGLDSMESENQIDFEEEESFLEGEQAHEFLEREQHVPGDPNINELPTTTLADVIDPKTGVVLMDNLMSVTGSTVYNFFAKGHKSSPQDWNLSNSQLDALYPVTRDLMQSIEVKSENPYYAFIGVLGAIYISKAGEVRSHYKSQTKLRKEADVNKFNNQKKAGSKLSGSAGSGSGSGYVRKWKDKKAGVPNMEHKHWQTELGMMELENMKGGNDV